jgi:tetratricopeptide (TPR) repeat protein
MSSAAEANAPVKSPDEKKNEKQNMNDDRVVTEDIHLDTLNPSLGIEVFLAKAKAEEKVGNDNRATIYYLHVLKTWKDEQQHAPRILLCLNKLAQICNKNKRYQEAVNYGQAAKLMYEQVLLELDEVTSAGPEGAAQGDVYAEMEAEEEGRQARHLEKLAEIFHGEGRATMARAYALQAIRLRTKIEKEGVKNQAIDAVADQGRAQYLAALSEYHEPPEKKKKKKKNKDKDAQEGGEVAEYVGLDRRAMEEERAIVDAVTGGSSVLTRRSAHPQSSAATATTTPSSSSSQPAGDQTHAHHERAMFTRGLPFQVFLAALFALLVVLVHSLGLDRQAWSFWTHKRAPI